MMIKVTLKVLCAATMFFSGAYGMQEAGVQTRQRSYGEELDEQIVDSVREIRASLNAIPTDTTGLTPVQIKCNEQRRQYLTAYLARCVQTEEQRSYQEAVTQAADQVQVPDQDQVRPTQAREVQSKRRAAERQEAGVSVLVRERFKNRFIAAYRKSEFAQALQDHLDAKSNVSQNVIDIGLNDFIDAYTDNSFEATHTMMQAVDTELKKCRGGKAGLFFYNAYNSAWYKKIYRENRAGISADRMLLDACNSCLEKNKNNPEIILVLGMMQDYLSQNKHEGAHFLMNIALSQYRSGHHKYFYKIYTNPRRTLCILLAAVIAGCYYYTRDY